MTSQSIMFNIKTKTTSCTAYAHEINKNLNKYDKKPKLNIYKVRYGTTCAVFDSQHLQKVSNF